MTDYTTDNLPTEPGVYPDLPFEVYAAIPAVNASLLKAAVSPLHVQHYQTSRDNDTASRGMLRSAHALMFEPHHFLRDFSWYGGRRDKRHKAYQAHIADHPGTTVLNSAEIADAAGMGMAAWQHPVTGPVLAHPDRLCELVGLWVDEATGLMCKGRFDHVIPGDDEVVVTDGKGIGSTDNGFVGRQALKLGWHLQAAHYVAGARALWPGRPVRFQILGVETKAPHDCGLYLLDDIVLGGGETFRRQRLDLYAAAVASGDWHGRHTAPVYLDFPDWGLPHVDADGLDFDSDDSQEG